jgi:cell division protein FtsW (lipid II flippase)
VRQYLEPVSNHQIQTRLFILAGGFLFFYSISLSLANAVRERSWAVDYRWSHWIGFLIWLVIFTILNNQVQKRLSDSDPYILPIASLLSGWGILTIFRLIPEFGFRQTAWLVVCGLVFFVAIRLSSKLQSLRRYKYVWLTSGLVITALTLIFGTEPGGGNVHAWLGCCGVYFQPSEPLKLLLIIYLSGYLADRLPLKLRLLPLLAPTAIIIGLAIILLLIQRDLGTASIFIFLYSIILFVGSGKKRVLFISFIGVVLAGTCGYFLFDLIHLRIDAWLNPWVDPSGRSFQIVQSLMAVANGGIFGRGPGLGSPGLVPVAISDFIFTSIAEENGLAGTIGLITLIAFLSVRSVRVALRATDNFQRILSAGIAAYFAAQSILILGGNIRFLPLTGVTLPFVSYGGSSLLTSTIAIAILLIISNQTDVEPAPLPRYKPYLFLASFLVLGMLALAITNAWWAVWRGPDILERTDNPRRAIADTFVKRGSLLDRFGTPINQSEGEAGNYYRNFLYPALAPITGYTNPVYGQSGLEASLDPYLRGLKGNSAFNIWWNHIVYGQPPPGLNVRLSIDLHLQRKADDLLGEYTGALVLINASSGEILAMASHPSFDPNQLDTQASMLFQDINSPLLDRATQGQYPPGDALAPFFQAANYFSNSSQSVTLFRDLGFFDTPELRLPAANPSSPGSSLLVSPLQMSIAAASLSNSGVRPAPRLAMAVSIPNQTWVVLPALSDPVSIFTPAIVAETTKGLMINGQSFWMWNASITQATKTFTWFLGGTLPDWRGTPMAVVVLLEENNIEKARFIGQTLLNSYLQP